MMKREWWSGLSVLALLSACAAAPTQEMSDARQSVNAARQVNAASYAPVVLNQAEAALSIAERDLSLRAYRQARREALEAKASALKAHALAVAIGDAKTTLSQAERAGTVSEEARSRLIWAEQAAAAGNDDAALRYAESARIKALSDLRRAEERQNGGLPP